MKSPNQRPDTNNSRSNAKASQSGGKRPENKDNLDHRGNEEQEKKGGDVTHNKKATKKSHLKGK
jgi:hypothetical protein